jgi:hypothetical protein
MTKGCEFDSRQGQKVFVFSITSRGPTSLLIQWVPGSLSPGTKWQGHEANHSPIRLHGVGLN